MQITNNPAAPSGVFWDEWPTFEKWPTVGVQTTRPAGKLVVAERVTPERGVF